MVRYWFGNQVEADKYFETHQLKDGDQIILASDENYEIAPLLNPELRNSLDITALLEDEANFH